MDKWKLIRCEDLDWEQDKSGYYCVINSVLTGAFDREVRLDVMTTGDMPAVSFQGSSEAVRKTFARYAEEHGWDISIEHATYIGRELFRCQVVGEYYIQD